MRSEKMAERLGQENELLKKQNKKLYDIMYEILGLAKIKSATVFG
jgi:hypothetical protein